MSVFWLEFEEMRAWHWSNILPSSWAFHCLHSSVSLETWGRGPGLIFHQPVVHFSIHVLAWVWRDVDVALV